MEDRDRLIKQLADDYSTFLKEAKSMGCNEVKALYNIPLKNMEMIVQALEKQIPKKPIKSKKQVVRYVNTYYCPICNLGITGTNIAKLCYHCGQKLDWSDEK